MIIKITADRDAYTREEEGYKNINYGDGEIMVGENFVGTAYYEGYFGFSLNNLIPVDQSVTAVTFNFFVSSLYVSWEPEISFGATTIWNEHTITYNNRPTVLGGCGSATLPARIYEQWQSVNLPGLIPYINTQRPSGFVSLSMSLAAPHTATISSDENRAYLLLTVGTMTLSDRLIVTPVQGTIGKRAADVKIAPVQGPINKQILSIKIAPAQGPINKTVF